MVYIVAVLMIYIVDLFMYCGYLLWLNIAVIFCGYAYSLYCGSCYDLYCGYLCIVLIYCSYLL